MTKFHDKNWAKAQVCRHATVAACERIKSLGQQAVRLGLCHPQLGTLYALEKYGPDEAAKLEKIFRNLGAEDVKVYVAHK